MQCPLLGHRGSLPFKLFVFSQTSVSQRQSLTKDSVVQPGSRHWSVPLSVSRSLVSIFYFSFTDQTICPEGLEAVLVSTVNFSKPSVSKYWVVIKSSVNCSNHFLLNSTLLLGFVAFSKPSVSKYWVVIKSSVNCSNHFLLNSTLRLGFVAFPVLVFQHQCQMWNCPKCLCPVLQMTPSTSLLLIVHWLWVLITIYTDAAHL